MGDSETHNRDVSGFASRVRRINRNRRNDEMAGINGAGHISKQRGISAGSIGRDPYLSAGRTAGDGAGPVRGRIDHIRKAIGVFRTACRDRTHQIYFVSRAGSGAPSLEIIAQSRVCPGAAGAGTTAPNTTSADEKFMVRLRVQNVGEVKVSVVIAQLHTRHYGTIEEVSRVAVDA